MKKFAAYFLTVTMSLLYLVSTMGFGIHECSHDGSKNLIVLFGESPCEYVHSHLDNQGHIYSHSHAADPCRVHRHVDGHMEDCGIAEGTHSCNCFDHDARCCHTAVFVLSQAQTVQDDDRLIPAAPSQDLVCGALPADETGISVYKNMLAVVPFLSERPAAAADRTRPYLSCWRL